MTPIRLVAPSLLVLLIASCAPSSSNQYDTPGTAAPADSAAANAPADPSSNPVYDTPAAYEESTAATTPVQPNVNIPASPNIPVTPTTSVKPAALSAAPKVPTNGAAIIHTVVAGDTLSGISAKYKVPSAAIKQANGMTKDTVVLGKKMVIPPH